MARAKDEKVHRRGTRSLVRGRENAMTLSEWFAVLYVSAVVSVAIVLFNVYRRHREDVAWRKSLRKRLR
jgi:hypothetical protein